MRFTSYLLNLRRPFPYRYWVNRSLTALPGSSPRIQFLFVRLTLCYRLPSSVRYLPDSVESLVLPSIGRTVDFHHQTHVRCWAHKENPDSSQELPGSISFVGFSQPDRSSSLPKWLKRPLPSVTGKQREEIYRLTGFVMSSNQNV